MNTDTSKAHRDALDPTGEVNLEDTAAVERAIKAILDRNYGSGYDAALLAQATGDLIRAYRGDYPGLLRCDTLYHDLRHALETGLTTARLLDGYAKSRGPDSLDRIDGEHALLAVLLALFHDIGLLRRDTEAALWGPVLIPIHEERGVEFMQDYLALTSLSPLAGLSRLIMATKLIFQMPADWTRPERKLASMVASADLLSQCADRCYLEKCRDFLFEEFCAFGLAGTADSPYPDRETLLAKTPEFFNGLFRQRLDKEFGGIHRLLQVHTGDGNPWTDAIERSVGYLQGILPDKDFARLRRHPLPFV
ncbi:MAG: hypothetical protein PHY45_15340 [Rhodocyclaceae bacterium]|nr:hypothetical protein [Rhodocyclaceae bacterium]